PPSVSTPFPYTTLFRSGRKDEPAPSPSAPAPARPEVAPPARPAAPRPAAAAPPPAAPSSSGRGQAVIGKSLKVKGAITGTEDLLDRKSTRLNSSHVKIS